MSEDSLLIGVDIGGTKTLAAAVDEQLDPVAVHRVSTAADDPDAVVAGTSAAIDAVVDQLGGRPIASIGVGIPGLVDHAAGTVRHAVNLGIGDRPLDLGARLAERHSVPCAVENDVNAAAVGACRLLQRKEPLADLAYLSIGTGIAAGIVLDGRLHRGHRGLAGEIGHLPVVADGPRCRCGLTGCLETVASGSAIASLWPTDDGSPTAALLAAAARGDARATSVTTSLADHLATAVYLLALTYDVDRIVIGGGVGDQGQPIVDLIASGVGRLAAESQFVRSLDLPSRIATRPDERVGAIGAALLGESVGVAT